MFSVLSLICASMLIAVVRLEQQDPLIAGENHFRSCMRTNQIGADQLERLQNADFSDGLNREIQCYIHCFMQRSHFYDPDGHLNAVRAAKGLSYEYQKDYALQTMNVCKYMRGNNDCETSYQVYRCFKQGVEGHAR